MGNSAQDGSTPQPTNPGMETPGAGQPAGGQPSAPEAKQDAPVGPDYKSFFEEQMAARANEQRQIQEKLADSKISREERLNLKERELDLREEMAKYGANKGPVTAPDLSFVPESKRALLQDTLSKVSAEEAAAIMDFTRQMYDGVSVQGNPPAKDPANLDGNKEGVPPGVSQVKLSSANLLGVDADNSTVEASRAGFWEFLAGLKQ